MHFKRMAQNIVRNLCCLNPQESDESEQIAIRPGLEPDEAQVMEPGRLYQDFVEREARKYWQEIGAVRNLTKPTREEIREAAMPILCRALRRRPGSGRYPDLAHRGVAAMVQHAYERGWITPPFSEAYDSPNYVEALVRLADNANWLAREIPLPDHPAPHHPTIYYTIGYESGTPVPVPMEDSFILANYVHEQSGKPATDEDIVIYPWVSSENHPYPDISLLERRGWDACYKLVFKDGTVKILIMWSRQMERVTHAIFIQCLDDMHFSPISPNTPDERPA